MLLVAWPTFQRLTEVHMTGSGASTWGYELLGMLPGSRWNRSCILPVAWDVVVLLWLRRQLATRAAALPRLRRCCWIILVGAVVPTVL
jgi:hypothetical protein